MRLVLLMAALVVSFSVSATRYEVVCAGGGDGYSGKFKFDTGQSSLESGATRLNIIPANGYAKYYSADNVIIGVSLVKDLLSSFGTVKDEYAHIMLQFKDESTQRYTGICGIINVY